MSIRLNDPKIREKVAELLKARPHLAAITPEQAVEVAEMLQRGDLQMPAVLPPAVPRKITREELENPLNYSPEPIDPDIGEFRYAEETYTRIQTKNVGPRKFEMFYDLDSEDPK